MKTAVALVDVMTGKDATVAILAALAARERGVDAPRHLELSLSASAAAALVNVAQNVLVSGQDAKRWGNAHANLVPYQLFDAADRPLVIAVGSDSQWRAAATALGLDALANDPELATNAGRIAQRARVVGELARQLRTAPAVQWMDRLGQAGVPCGLVRTVAEALANGPASSVTGVTPAAGGEIRFAPPPLDRHGEIIRRHYWRTFNLLPILDRQDV